MLLRRNSSGSGANWKYGGMRMTVERRPHVRSGSNTTLGLVIVSGLLLILFLAVFSFLVNRLGHPAANDLNAPAERFAPIHRPFVLPPPDRETQPKPGSMLEWHFVQWRA